MGIMDKLKKFVNVSEEGYVDDDDVNYEEDDFDYTAPTAPRAQEQNSFASRTVRNQSAGSKVVDIDSAAPAQKPVAKPHVVFKKIDRFENVGEVADILNEKRIVILNLETCPNDISQRIIDFLYGVAYANKGDFKRVAGRAYIITPYNVPVSGELLDEISNMSSF